VAAATWRVTAKSLRNLLTSVDPISRGMVFVVKEDVALYPFSVSGLGAEGIMLEAHYFA